MIPGSFTPITLQKRPWQRLDDIEHLSQRPEEKRIRLAEPPINGNVADLRNYAEIDCNHRGWSNASHPGRAESSEAECLQQDEVCFGMIPDIKVRLGNDMDISVAFRSSSMVSQSNSGFINLGMLFSERRCDIVAPSGQMVAVMNTESFQSLTCLQHELQIRFAGLIRSPYPPEFSQLTSKDPASQLLSIDVLVFGYRVEADAAAAKLASYDYFLQDPDFVPPGFPYENPQYLDLPDIVRIDPSNSTTSQPPGGSYTEILDVNQTDDLYLDFDRMLDTFACHDGLVQISAVPQISTNLLSHQKEGLGFILERETIHQDSRQSLWVQQRSEESECGSLIYTHAITGSKSPNARERAGGIIADEMGLGKTLTMLSAIVGTRDRAFTYAKRMTKMGPSDPYIIAAKSTLVIVPSALLIDGWVEELQRHILPRTVTYHRYYGGARKVEYPMLLRNDIVFTTYGTVLAGFSRKSSLLHDIHWYRIVLDEAHVIRNASTKQFQAVTALNSFIKWALTGTPIQNSLEDLGSLVRFLKIPILEDGAQFKRHIIAPIQQKPNRVQIEYRNLQTLLKSTCLRRTKAVLPMAHFSTITHCLDFTSDERQEYCEIERLCREALDLAVSGHKTKEAHQNVLETLLRLRLYCNNGAVYGESLTRPYEGPKDPGEALSLLQQSGQAICYYCSCDITSLAGSNNDDSAVLTFCRRVVCSDCIPSWKLAIVKSSHCPLCRSSHNLDMGSTEADGTALPPANYPSKIRALCQDILDHRQEGKCIVFSFWKKSLDIVGALLDAQGVPFLRVDGSLPFRKRKDVLTQFQSQSNIAVLLMTLGTGAVGLNNLSIANRIHLLEPQWNPSVESQAIGRVVRLGQQRPVTVVQYVMNKTVEEIVQRKQLWKLKLARGGFAHGRGGDTKSAAQFLRELLIPG